MTRHAIGTRYLVPAVATVATLVLAAGCGVQAEDSVRSLPGSDRSALATPTASRQATQATTLWMVNRDSKLVRVFRRMPAEPSVEEVVRRLAIGPDDTERERGLRTAVGFADVEVPPASAVPDPAPPVADSAAESATDSDVPRVAVVTVSDEFRDLPATEQVLAIGQYVLSLTDSDYATVSFVATDGSPLAVPTPGGQLLDRPLTAEDYYPLRARQ